MQINLLKINLRAWLFFIFLLSLVFLNFYGSRTKANTLFLFIAFVYLAHYRIVTTQRIRIPKLIKAYFYFYLTAFFSIFYAISTKFVVDVLVPMTSLMLSMVIIFNFVKTNNHFKLFSYYFLIISSALAVYLILNFEGIRGFILGGVNTVPILLTTASFISIFWIINGEKRFAVFLPLFATVILISGSRKFIPAIAATFLIYFFLLGINLKIRTIVFKFLPIVLIVTIGAYYASQNELFQGPVQRVTYFFESIVEGDRMEVISGYDFRNHLKQKGFEFFKGSPVFGYGLNNFRALYGSETGLPTYSHNNYLEILVGMGLIGFVFYLGFIYQLYKLIYTNRFLLKREVYYFFLSAPVSFLIIGYYQHLYWEFFSTLFYVFILSYIFLKQKDERENVDKNLV